MLEKALCRTNSSFQKFENLYRCIKIKEMEAFVQALNINLMSPSVKKNAPNAVIML